MAALHFLSAQMGCWESPKAGKNTRRVSVRCPSSSTLLTNLELPQVIRWRAKPCCYWIPSWRMGVDKMRKTNVINSVFNLFETSARRYTPFNSCVTTEPPRHQPSTPATIEWWLFPMFRRSTTINNMTRSPHILLCAALCLVSGRKRRTDFSCFASVFSVSQCYSQWWKRHSTCVFLGTSSA